MRHLWGHVWLRHKVIHVVAPTVPVQQKLKSIFRLRQFLPQSGAGTILRIWSFEKEQNLNGRDGM